MAGILLLILVLTTSFQSLLITSIFSVYQEEITARFCVNKNSKTIPNCHGKCHLKKQLAKTSENQENPDVQKEQLFQLVFSQDINLTVGLPNKTAIKTMFFAKNWQLPKYLFKHSIFHPPTI